MIQSNMQTTKPKAIRREILGTWQWIVYGEEVPDCPSSPNLDRAIAMYRQAVIDAQTDPVAL